MKKRPLAAIDMGTNTFRLLIAEVLRDNEKNSYSFRQIHSARIITRLGEGMHDSGMISGEAMDRGVAALKEFSDTISGHHVHRTWACATSGLRNATNSREFISRAKVEAGIDIEIITGEQEARLTAAGMLTDIAMPGTALMADIGGGSTELIFSRRSEPVLVKSLDLGVVYSAGRYMKNDPPLNEDLKNMEEDISGRIMSGAGAFRKLIEDDTVFIGGAGTITALAAMAQRLTRYEHSMIHNFRLTRETVKELYCAISAVTSRERAEFIPFEPARLDIIVPGTLILFKLMETFGFNDILVSNYGLREGILIDLFNRT
ncbi:MAG: Ppx/GppA family phosphatase, partial [Nitrospirota bacterium]|nr:Ppx/GppA family phosphatase [Nitrospirota bacterium]